MKKTHVSGTQDSSANRADLMIDVDKSYLAYSLPVPRPFMHFRSGHFPAGTTTQRHHHSIVAMHGSLQGPLTLQTSTGRHALDAGDFCILAPGVDHCWSNAGTHTAATVSFLIDTDRPGRWPVSSGIAEACRELNQLVQGIHYLNSAGDPDLQHAFWQIADQLTVERPWKKLGVAGRLWTFLGLVLERLSPDLINAREHGVAQQIRRLLLSRVNDRLTIAEVAESVHVSATCAKEVFRATFGCGIMSYFNELKIWQAKRLLCDPSLTIDQVSSKLGFSSPTYFSQTFRKHTGETPSEFRK
ncbi:Arabinose operon regulatory protein [Gimesia alba]|uniref:Arabinose operon regulatory protein n=1 Tax=Gimesia alba TaxID=2527973 RepID=A0A517RCU0_9PLAN|nr:helix-turn-helix domain-containing protein [Gimesia alba]QDT41666.1 Arabinose operon regulatory protein [Gimesia alba]